MADTAVEEPQFTSLSARIAALKQQGVASNAGGAPQSTGKKPPPPLPPSAKRPPLPTRTQTANNPPIASYGSSATKQANNLPVGARGTPLLPPPGVDRDRNQNRPSSPGNTAKTPPLPSRPGPPRLPSRKATEPSPALPPRNGSAQLARRDSDASTMSLSSTISGLSLGQAPSSASSVDSPRKLPPPLGSTKLPPLPPTRRELEQRRAEEEANAPPKIPLVSTKSASNVSLRPPPAVDRDMAPKIPIRPADLPKMPARLGRGNVEEEQPPAQPPRRLPPPSTARSALSMGFGNKSSATPNPGPRPAPTFTRRPGPAVVELDDKNFDSIVMSGKPSFVDFYATFCKHCDDIEPKWQKMGEDFAFAHERLTIAKINIYEHKDLMKRFNIDHFPTMFYFDGHSETPQECMLYNEFEYIVKFLEEKSGIRAADGPKSNGAPPPINLSSKPSKSEVEAVRSAPAAAPPPSSGCLICRDFSGPDGEAAKHPRGSLPRTHDDVGYLADVLCRPFSSATDKARAIFTWLHHNINYDTVAFFNRTVNYGATPQDTISSGLAVCGGYAGLFEAIALKAGLEAVMVTGHGKGYGYAPLQKGEPIPKCDPTGHAWNAVRIDGGEWKLLDACWGSGNLANQGSQVYNRSFTPSYFTMSNEEFGIKHFPSDMKSFYLSDGRIPTWEEYMIGPVGAEALELYGIVPEYGLSQTSFSPPQKHIPVNSNEVVRFQFSKMCEHWDHEKNGSGKPYPLVIRINGVDGRKEDYVAMENNDFWWWVDIPAKDLGAPGQKVNCYSVTTVNGKDSRGMTRREYLNKKGRSAMGFGGLSAWELV